MYIHKLRNVVQSNRNISQIILTWLFHVCKENFTRNKSIKIWFNTPKYTKFFLYKIFIATQKWCIQESVFRILLKTKVTLNGHLWYNDLSKGIIHVFFLLHTELKYLPLLGYYKSNFLHAIS